MKKVLVEISDDPEFCDTGPGGKTCDYNPCDLDCNECGLSPSFVLSLERELEYDHEKARYRKCQWCLSTYPVDVQIRSIKPYRTCLECAESCPGEETSGLLANLCDVLFGDPKRAETYGYEGVLERVREVMELLKNPK